jgi:hypothetical protein
VVNELLRTVFHVDERQSQPGMLARCTAVGTELIESFEIAELCPDCDPRTMAFDRWQH